MAAGGVELGYSFGRWFGRRDGRGSQRPGTAGEEGQFPPAGQALSPAGQTAGVCVFLSISRRLEEVAAQVLDLDVPIRVVREFEQALLGEDHGGKLPTERALHQIFDGLRVFRVDLDLTWDDPEDHSRRVCD